MSGQYFRKEMTVMDKQWLFLCLLFFVLSELSMSGSFAQAADAPIVCENDQVSLSIEPVFGTITRILDKSSRIDLTSAPVLAENFRLIVLKPDKKKITIIGKHQKLSSVKRTSDGLSLTWNGPLKDTAGAEHKITVRMDVKLTGNTLEFTLHLDNHTENIIREAWYPIIGGLSRFGAPGQPPDGVIWAPIIGRSDKGMVTKIESPFHSVMFAYPGRISMSFTCVQSAAAGKSLYFASHDEIARYKCYRFHEFAGKDIKDVFACIQHNPFTPPGGSFDGSKVVMKIVNGDWHAAGRVYREFFKSTFGLADLKTDWIRRQSVFLMTMFMLPEGTINYTFKDIPRWAKCARDHGVNAVQISGWQVGGHDNGYPYYISDPRLGTWKELEDGIRTCHEMGLKVFFFVNYQPMMISSDWYKNELHKYREWKSDGGLTWNTGWGMGTLWARMGHPKLETWADLGFPQFRKIITDQFEALAKIGADGVHVDKMFPAAISYNPDSPMSPDTSTWEGAILLSKEVMAACRKHNPDWAMSFECNWDRVLQFGGATWWVGNQRMTRCVFPENVETLAITEAFDYLGVNNAVRNGHAIMLAPMDFSRGMDWKPLEGLNDYIRDVKCIQDKLQETVFLGEVLGHDGMTLAGEPAQGIDYNVFRNRRTALRACILTNSSMEKQKQIIEKFSDTQGGAVRVHTPATKNYTAKLPALIEVPAERIVFVEELTSVPDDAKSPYEPSIASESSGISSVPNGNFETGDFAGWTAESNWVIADDSRQYYSGWHGRSWAWSGNTGEAATGKLTSKPFLLDKDGVQLLISGWASIHGTGKPRQWNYVTLNLADGTEIDRVYAPNTTCFVSVFLDGTKHKGKQVYVQAVDDADQPSYSMLCIDDVCTADLPADVTTPSPKLPPFDPARYVRIADDNLLVEISRENGSVTRLQDKKTGIDLILEPRLAGSWKFAFPLPGKEPWQTIEANWIIGCQQKLTTVKTQDNKLVLRWNGPLKNYLGESYEASVTQTIDLTDGGALFSLNIDNRTPYQVGETYFPLLGGTQGLGDTRGELKATELVRPANEGSTVKTNIFRIFGGMSAFGDQGPELFYAYPETQPEPWIAFRTPKRDRSVVIRAADSVDRKLVAHFELQPSSTGTTRDDGDWPRADELNGQPVGVVFSFVDCAGGTTGKNYQAAPVLVRFIDGVAISSPSSKK